VALSVFVTEFARDEGPALHTHPYPEVFLVDSGTGAFTLGDEERTVTGGHVLVVPALMPHGFKGAGDDTLRVVSIHPSGHHRADHLGPVAVALRSRGGQPAFARRSIGARVSPRPRGVARTPRRLRWPTSSAT
jgi:hypothetical protein